MSIVKDAVNASNMPWTDSYACLTAIVDGQRREVSEKTPCKIRIKLHSGYADFEIDRALLLKATSRGMYGRLDFYSLEGKPIAWWGVDINDDEMLEIRKGK